MQNLESQDISNKVSILNNNITQNVNTNRFRNEQRLGYVTGDLRDNRVITFPKSSSAKATAIKEVNKTLCGLLVFAMIISIVSYFFVVSSEIKLNECSRKTTILNVENSELQNKLDKLKSFNNVDLTMQKSNLLQRPEKVIETMEVGTNSQMAKKSPLNNTSKPRAWTIGY